MSIFAELKAYASFLVGLPAFAREELGTDEAKAILRRRLDRRGTHLLNSLERSVFERPGTPYHRLATLAGCELGDVRALVRREGVEAALRELREAGVYLTFEEFKGHRPIERGGHVIETRPGDFDNPASRRYLASSTGGSTGDPRRVLMDLDHLRSRRAAMAAMGEAHGFQGLPFAQWAEIPPGHGLEAALVRATSGSPPERWFTPTWGPRFGRGARFRWATRTAVGVARASGARVPVPEHVPLDRADVVLDWVQSGLAAHGRCVLQAHVSKALRVALAAEERGVDLTGLLFSSGGEPASEGKVERITRTGARFLANYFLMEAGPVGLGCADPREPNEHHFMADHLGLITRPREVVPGVIVSALSITTLLPMAPKLLLNVELDDYGVVDTRSCGCGFGAMGFHTHLRGIRSFKKLTGEGVTLIGSDMERILEQVLPERFGGSPLDYQLVEEEDDEGLTRLTLHVHPRVGQVDEGEIVTTVHRALGRAGGAAEAARELWRQAGTLSVRREPPRLNARGDQWLLVRARGKTQRTPAGRREEDRS